jgi:hypothetical protein
MNKKKIFASIVLYKNPAKQAQKAISSILASDLCTQLFLIDNSPTDYLSRIQGIDKRISYTFNNQNIGYGAAHNIALKNSIALNAKYHIILNPDTYFDKDVVFKIYQYIEKHADVGHVMPKVLSPDGKIQYLAKLLPTPQILFFRRFFNIPFLQNRINNTYELRFSGYNRIINAPYLSGCFMFLRVRALKSVGLFDEKFFMYPEDIDLTRRIHSKYRTIFFPYAHIYHEHQKESFHSFKMTKIHAMNMVKYFNKWGWFFDKRRSQINKNTLNRLSGNRSL